jgi:hypothetical protein
MDRPSDTEPGDALDGAEVILLRKCISEIDRRQEDKLARLKRQYAQLQFIEREAERKKQVANDIADLREKIKSMGEIPCA